MILLVRFRRSSSLTPSEREPWSNPSLASQAVKLIQRDWEVAHARSGRMIDRVGNRRGDADDPDLAKPLDAERVGVVRLVHEDVSGLSRA
jgi:hypothetical protein